MNSPFGLIQFKGEQTLKLLQGQCTQMVTNLNAEHAPLIAFCDPRGRMFGSGRLLKYNNIISFIRFRINNTRSGYNCTNYYDKNQIHNMTII